MENNGRPLAQKKAFIKPEDLFYASAYLLFSDERDKEKENAGRIERAFADADLSPKRLVVQNGMMILECQGYVAHSFYDKYNSSIDNFFTRVFAESIVQIPAGKVPPKISGRDANERVYEFVASASR